jgi:hypothetical protein
LWFQVGCADVFPDFQLVMLMAIATGGTALVMVLKQDLAQG